jgi:uroporphyrinogen III methyltransferase/synthase
MTPLDRRHRGSAASGRDLHRVGHGRGAGDSPLRGRTVMVTRPRAQAGEMARDLERLGARVILFPTIRIEDPDDAGPLREAVGYAESFDWIVFTSVNGVDRFWAELRAQGGDTRRLAGVSICAIGPATAAAIELEGATPDVVPVDFVAEGVVAALAGEADLAGARILLPRAQVARAVLPEALRQHGAEVLEVAAYRTVPDGAEADRARAAIDGQDVDVITFTSSSTVRSYVQLLGARTGGAVVASIGPITSDTAREVGLDVDVEAAEYTVPALIDAIVERLGG